MALQIEDFGSAADTTPLSTIALQFVALVISSPLSCTDRPQFIGVTRVDGSCIGVPFNTTWSEAIIAQTTFSNARYMACIPSCRFFNSLLLASSPGFCQAENEPRGRG